jgi:hypothetical protein
MFRNVRICLHLAQRDLNIRAADQHFACDTACPFRAVAQFFQLFIETEICRAAWHDDRTLLRTMSVNIVELHRIDPPCRSQRTISSALTAMERPSLWMKQKHSWRGEKLLLYRRAKVLLGMFDGGEQQNPAPFSPSSEHETKILRLFAKGKLKPNRKPLNISLQTLRNHLHPMNQKLRTHNRLEAVMDGCDLGLPD